MQHITPSQLRERLQHTPPPLLLDVREPHEFGHCNLKGSRNIPMQTIARRLDELDADADIVVICHHGMRSQQVADFLEQRGFRLVSNLSGGLDAWAKEVDPSMPRY